MIDHPFVRDAVNAWSCSDCVLPIGRRLCFVVAELRREQLIVVSASVSAVAPCLMGQQLPSHPLDKKS